MGFHYLAAALEMNSRAHCFCFLRDDPQTHLLCKKPFRTSQHTLYCDILAMSLSLSRPVFIAGVPIPSRRDEPCPRNSQIPPNFQKKLVKTLVGGGERFTLQIIWVTVLCIKLFFPWIIPGNSKKLLHNILSFNTFPEFAGKDKILFVFKVK